MESGSVVRIILLKCILAGLEIVNSTNSYNHRDFLSDDLSLHVTQFVIPFNDGCTSKRECIKYVLCNSCKIVVTLYTSEILIEEVIVLANGCHWVCRIR